MHFQNKTLWGLTSSACWGMWDMLHEVLAVELATKGALAVVKLLREEEDEEVGRRGSLAAGRLAPSEAPELEGRPMGPGIWHWGQYAQEGGRELPASEKARGKVPDIEPQPLKNDEEPTWWL